MAATWYQCEDGLVARHEQPGSSNSNAHTVEEPVP